MTDTAFPSPSKIHSQVNDHSLAQFKQQEIKQKKARLYDLKNRLLKYQSFEGVPIEELQSLCENLNMETHTNSDKSIDLQEEKTTLNNTTHQPRAVHMQQRQEREQLPALDRCCQNVYIIKLKQVLIILLVVVCIIVKNTLPNGSTYDIGEFSIYQTKYSRNTFEDDKAGKQGKGLSLLNNLIGMDEQMQKVKLYLPKRLQKMKKKDQKELSYEKCIDRYNPICIDYRLTLYGSMNLQLEDWILDHLTGQERIIFESSVDFLLSIILSAIKMKNLALLGHKVNKISIIQSDGIDLVQLNSIKLSLIENQCQDYVEIIRLESQPYRKISQYTYVFVSQQFYLYNIYPFGQNPASIYPNTSFILYLARGMNDTLKVLLKQASQMHIVEVEFKMTEEKFYSERELDQKEMAFNDRQERMRIMVVRHKKEDSDAGHKLTVINNEGVSLQYNQIQPPLPSETSTTLQSQQSQSIGPQLPPIQNLVPIKHITPFSKLRPRNLAIEQHPCITQDSYDILPIMSYFDKHVYIQTIFNYKLLIPLEKAPMYKQKGAISPELLFFISQNIKKDDVVFFTHELYQDDLVLMVAARAISQKVNFHCVTPDANHQVLNENLRMNGLKQFVQFAYFSMTEEEKTKKYYEQQNFNIFFLTQSFFIRDYNHLAAGHLNRIIIFYWLFDVNFFQFMKELTKKHKVWAILQRFQKITLLNSCINYGLSEVTESNILQVDRSWLIVQL